MILEEIRTALAAQIKDYIQRDCNVSAWPDASPPLPTVQVWPAPDYIDVWLTKGGSGLSEVRYRIRVETMSQNGQSAARVMDEFLSPGGSGESSSIIDAIMSDPTLGGVVEAATPLSVSVDVDPETYNHVGFIEVRVAARKNGARA